MRIAIGILGFILVLGGFALGIVSPDSWPIAGGIVILGVLPLVALAMEVAT